VWWLRFWFLGFLEYFVPQIVLLQVVIYRVRVDSKKGSELGRKKR